MRETQLRCNLLFVALVASLGDCGLGKQLRIHKARGGFVNSMAARACQIAHLMRAPLPDEELLSLMAFNAGLIASLDGCGRGF